MKNKHARILIADDDERMRTGVSRYLHLNSYSVENAADGAEALEKIITAQHTIYSYDLLICDLGMPLRLLLYQEPMTSKRSITDTSAENCFHLNI